VLQVHPPITARSGEAPPAKVLIQIRHVNGDGVSDVLRRRAAPKSSWIAVPWAVGREAAPAGGAIQEKFLRQNVAGMWLKCGVGPKKPCARGTLRFFPLRDDLLTRGVDKPRWVGL